MTRSTCGQQLLDGQRRRVDSRRPVVEHELELTQPVDVAVQDIDLGAHADRDLGRVLADDAAPDDHDPSSRHARHAAEEHAAPAHRLLEHEGARLRRDLAGDLAHRRQQRQTAARIGDRLIGDACRARGDEARRQFGIRREVQVGEERVARAQKRHLGRLRLLDLDDELRLAEDRLRVRDDRRALW